MLEQPIRQSFRFSFVPISNYQRKKSMKQDFVMLLKKYHDQSYITEFEDQEQKDKRIKIWYRLIKKFNAIKPQSTFLLYWNILIMVSIFFNFYQIPVSMFFTSAVYQAQFNSRAGITLNIIFGSALFLNMIIVRPITAFYQQGRIIKSRKSILKKYLKLQFWLNAIGWLSLFMYMISGIHQFVYGKLAFYLNFYTLQQVNKLISYKLQLWRVRYGLFKFFWIVSVLLLIIFWLASFFFAIDYKFYLQKNQYYPVNLWLTNSVCCQNQNLQFIDIIQTYEWYVWVNYAVYWALQTVSTVGYGDLTPRNPIQVAFCDVMILILCVVYAFFVSQVWQIFSELFEGENYYKNKIIKNYERNYKINRELVAKLQNYIYETNKAKQKQQKQKQINSNLSDQLKNQLILTRQKKLYANIPFFNEMQCFAEQYSLFLYKIASLTKQRRYGENQLIFAFKCLAMNLCLLIFGQVEFQIQNSKIRYQLDSKNKNKSFFGTYQFLTQSASNFSVKAHRYTKLSELDHLSFMETVRQFPIIHQRYQQLLEQLKIYQHYELCGEVCWICSSKYHNISNCIKFFQWLKFCRQVDVLYKIQTKRTRKIQFRQYFNRGYVRSQKLKKLLISSKQYLMKKKQLKDRLRGMNTNRTDQTTSFQIYRTKGNL